MNRRALLFGFAGLSVPTLFASPAAPLWRNDATRLDILRTAIRPTLTLYNAHTREAFNGSFFDATGYRVSELDQIDWFLRDWRQGEAKRTDARLLWALAAVRQAAEVDGHSGQIVVLSGYRTQKTNSLLRSKGLGAARNSFHLKARAVDFVLPGAPVELVAGYMRWLQVGGTGHYPKNFVHIDTGPKRTWSG